MSDIIRVSVSKKQVDRLEHAIIDLEARTQRLEHTVAYMHARVDMAILQADTLPDAWSDELTQVHNALRDLHIMVSGQAAGDCKQPNRIYSNTPQTRHMNKHTKGGADE